MLFRTKKRFLVSTIVSTFSTKMDPWSWTPTNPQNFQARRTGFLGQPTWVGGGGGGGPAKFWLGRGLGEGKSEDSLWRRDLSALGPFGAEANTHAEPSFVPHDDCLPKKCRLNLSFLRSSLAETRAKGQVRLIDAQLLCKRRAVRRKLIK